MVGNPRFPHKVVIKRESGVDDKGNRMYRPILCSECGMRIMDRDVDNEADVIKSKYKLALPKHGKFIDRNDSVWFTDCYSGEVKRGYVKEARESNFGANIWFNENENG